MRAWVALKSAGSTPTARDDLIVEANANEKARRANILRAVCMLFWLKTRIFLGGKSLNSYLSILVWSLPRCWLGTEGLDSLIL